MERIKKRYLVELLFLCLVFLQLLVLVRSDVAKSQVTNTDSEHDFPFPFRNQSHKQTRNEGRSDSKRRISARETDRLCMSSDYISNEPSSTELKEPVANALKNHNKGANSFRDQLQAQRNTYRHRAENKVFVSKTMRNREERRVGTSFSNTRNSINGNFIDVHNLSPRRIERRNANQEREENRKSRSSTQRRQSDVTSLSDSRTQIRTRVAAEHRKQTPSLKENVVPKASVINPSMQFRQRRENSADRFAPLSRRRSSDTERALVKSSNSIEDSRTRRISPASTNSRFRNARRQNTARGEGEKRLLFHRGSEVKTHETFEPAEGKKIATNARRTIIVTRNLLTRDVKSERVRSGERMKRIQIRSSDRHSSNEPMLSRTRRVTALNQGSVQNRNKLTEDIRTANSRMMSRSSIFRPNNFKKREFGKRIQSHLSSLLTRETLRNLAYIDAADSNDSGSSSSQSREVRATETRSVFEHVRDDRKNGRVTERRDHRNFSSRDSSKTGGFFIRESLSRIIPAVREESSRRFIRSYNADHIRELDRRSRRVVNEHPTRVIIDPSRDNLREMLLSTVQNDFVSKGNRQNNRLVFSRVGNGGVLESERRNERRMRTSRRLILETDSLHRAKQNRERSIRNLFSSITSLRGYEPITYHYISTNGNSFSTNFNSQRKASTLGRALVTETKRIRESVQLRRSLKNGFGFNANFRERENTRRSAVIRDSLGMSKERKGNRGVNEALRFIEREMTVRGISSPSRHSSSSNRRETFDVGRRRLFSRTENRRQEMKTNKKHSEEWKSLNIETRFTSKPTSISLSNFRNERRLDSKINSAFELPSVRSMSRIGRRNILGGAEKLRRRETTKPSNERYLQENASLARKAFAGNNKRRDVSKSMESFGGRRMRERRSTSGLFFETTELSRRTDPVRRILPENKRMSLSVYSSTTRGMSLGRNHARTRLVDSFVIRAPHSERNVVTRRTNLRISKSSRFRSRNVNSELSERRDIERSNSYVMKPTDQFSLRQVQQKKFGNAEEKNIDSSRSRSHRILSSTTRETISDMVKTESRETVHYERFDRMRQLRYSPSAKDVNLESTTRSRRRISHTNPNRENRELVRVTRLVSLREKSGKHQKDFREASFSKSYRSHFDRNVGRVVIRLSERIVRLTRKTSIVDGYRIAKAPAASLLADIISEQNTDRGIVVPHSVCKEENSDNCDMARKDMIHPSDSLIENPIEAHSLQMTLISKERTIVYQLNLFHSKRLDSGSVPKEHAEETQSVLAGMSEEDFKYHKAEGNIYLHRHQMREMNKRNKGNPRQGEIKENKYTTYITNIVLGAGVMLLMSAESNKRGLRTFLRPQLT